MTLQDCGDRAHIRIIFSHLQTIGEGKMRFLSPQAPVKL
jgi:hypothetical protein